MKRTDVLRLTTLYRTSPKHHFISPYYSPILLLLAISKSEYFITCTAVGNSGEGLICCTACSFGG